MFSFFNKKEKKEDAIARSSKAAYDLVNSEVWGDIRQMFVDKMIEIQSVANVEDKSPEAAFLDIKVRINLANELKDIVENIEGAALRWETNIAEKKPLSTDEDHIVRIESTQVVVE